MMCTKYNLLVGGQSVQFAAPTTDNYELDLTSVVNALEACGNPLQLFKQHSGARKALLHCLFQNISNISLWLNGTLYPSLCLMNSHDVVKIVDALQTLRGRIAEITHLVKTSKRSKACADTKYSCRCACDEPVVMARDGRAWAALQDHPHLEQALSLGRSAPATDDASTASDVDSASDESASRDNDVSVSDMSFNSVDSSVNSGLSELGVIKAMYPLKVVREVGRLENNKRFYTVQKVTDKRFRCLLCNVELNSESNVYQHAVGSTHTAAMANPAAVTRLHTYHNVFAQLPVECFIQATFFVPHDRRGHVTCRLCSEPVRAAAFRAHCVSRKHTARLSQKKYAAHLFYAKIIAFVFGVPAEEPGSAEEAPLGPVPTTLVYNSTYKATSTLWNEASKGAGEGEGEGPADSKDVEQVNGSRAAAPPPAAPSPLPQPGNSKVAAASAKVGRGGTHNVRAALSEGAHSVLESLERRFDAHKVFIKYFDLRPVCVPCATPIPENRPALKAHFLSKEHAHKSQVPRVIYRYWCDVCPQSLYTEFNWMQHLKSSSHKQRVASSAGPLAEYECTSCKYVLFGNDESLRKHRDKPALALKKPKPPKELKLPARIKLLFEDESRLLDEVNKFVVESQAVLARVQLSWKCCAAIQKALQCEFEQCRAYPFGSRISGLGSMMSDLDVFVDTGMMYEGLVGQDADSQAKLVKRTAKILKKHPDFADINSIPSARTPIVQVYHKVTGLDCDLSFRHGLSVENTAFLRLCIDVQPLLRHLILLLKHWSSVCRLNARISTYALSMLSIYFFQVNGFLPSVKRLRELEPTEPKSIGGWRSFCYPRSLEELKGQVAECQVPVRDLLRLVFRYYATFSFDKEVVCPLLGQPLPKADFHEEQGRRLPPDMRDYVQRLHADPDFEVFRSNAPMCIQDPFDLSHNLTKACTAEFVKKFVGLCQLSHGALS